MYDVHKYGITRVEASSNRIALEKWRSRIQPGDAADVFDFTTGETGYVCAQTKADQMIVFGLEVVVYVDGLDQIGDLLADQLRVRRCLDDSQGQVSNTLKLND